MEGLSRSAKLMYGVIAVAAGICTVCFVLYYGDFYTGEAVLWTGVTALMLVYHLGLRLILGKVSGLFPIRADMAWFRERNFEKKLYALLRVKKWKRHMPTYAPGTFSLENRTLSQIADTMAKAELDHWLNEGISLLSILFALLWGEIWIFLLTAMGAMVFDGLFVVIQRYNRPRVLRVIRRRKHAENPHNSEADAYILER